MNQEILQKVEPVQEVPQAQGTEEGRNWVRENDVIKDLDKQVVPHPGLLLDEVGMTIRNEENGMDIIAIATMIDVMAMINTIDMIPGIRTNLEKHILLEKGRAKRPKVMYIRKRFFCNFKSRT